MDQYKPKGYGPEPDNKCEEEYLSPLPLNPNRQLPYLPSGFLPTNYYQSSVSGVLLGSGESNFFDTFQKTINSQVYPPNSGINYEFPSGNFEDMRGFLEWYWSETPIFNIIDADGAAITVAEMTPKQLADFVFKNSGVFLTSHEDNWSYSTHRESGLFHFGRGDNQKYYKYYRIAFTDTLNRRRFVDVRQDITSLHNPYSSAVIKDINLSETQKEDFTLFNPYIHYSPYRDSPNSTSYQYVYINYLADYKVATLNSNPYKF